ncbi:MAG: AAA family ATPase [Methylococcaceae bacterium]|jgi:exonuclease SbcC
MKILNLHFKNINSLAGENWVDFEQAPFNETGVFAITGPNGSGKSSILDAITLGLYGETFRFDRPARHVMTQHTVECFANVEFAVAGQRYRASWRAQRENDDPQAGVLPPQSQLVRLGEVVEVLADTITQVTARLVEITGMNFRNFTRSILLAQGDFAAFLNALDSERMDILEKIVSADIYADHKAHITQTAEVAQSQLNAIKQELAAIPLLEAPAFEACEHDLIDYKDQFDELLEQQTTLTSQQQAVQNAAVLQGQISEQEQGLQQASINLQATQASLEKIILAADVLRFKEDVEAIKQKRHVLKQHKATQQDYADELKMLQNQLAQTDLAQEPALDGKSVARQIQSIEEIKSQIAQLNFERQSEANLINSLIGQSQEKKAVLETVQQWLDQHTAEQGLLNDFPDTGRLKKLRTELIELNQKQKTYNKWNKTTGATLKNNKATIQQEHKAIVELKQKLSEEEQQLVSMAEGNDLAGIEQLRLEQQDRVKAFQEMLLLGQQHQKLVGGGGLFSFFSPKKPVDDEAELALKLEQVEVEIGREDNIRRVLEDAVQRETLLKKLEPERQHLVNGKACPLCGSFQHPYAKRAPMVGNSHQALLDQRVKLQVLAGNASRLRQQLLVAQKAAEKNRETDNKLLQIKAQWLTLCNRLNTVSPELNIANLGLMQHLLKSESIELQEIARLAKMYQGSLSNIENYKTAISKSEATIQQLQAAVAQIEANNQQPDTQTDFQAAILATQQEEKVLSTKLQGQLAALNEKMPAKGKEDALYDRLNVRRQECHSYVFRQKSLTQELAGLAEKQSHCKSMFEQCNLQIEVLGKQLHQEEGVGLHLAVVDKQRLLADNGQTITQLETELKALQQQLQEKMHDSLFKNEHELGEMLALMETQPELERYQAELEQECEARQVLLEQGRELQTAELAHVPADASLEQIQKQLALVAERLDIVSLELQRLDKVIKDQTRMQQHYDALLIKYQDQGQIALQAAAEVAQLAIEDGRVFRRQVQAKMIERLLLQTNKVLEKINGRYYLRHKPSDQGLALEIEDTYQANARRLPKTLSGGETFVVSLALALGISELASQGKSVDSLFLDEGFGNLDAESLYTVISTLESLHTHGKTVGVISHVESVQKRFKAQLQIIKRADGMGELKKAS